MPFLPARASSSEVLVAFQSGGKREKAADTRALLIRFSRLRSPSPVLPALPARSPAPQDSHLQEVADLTVGFSGREIAKLAIAWQAAAYGTPNSSFTAELMTEVLDVSAGVRACFLFVWVFPYWVGWDMDRAD